MSRAGRVAGVGAGADAGAASASFGALQIAQQRNCASVSLWTYVHLAQVQLIIRATSFFAAVKNRVYAWARHR